MSVARLAAPAVLAALVLAAAAPRPVRAGPSIPVTVRALPGQVYEGNLQNPGDAHDFLLDDFNSGEDAVISISLKAAKGSSLGPDCSLLPPSAPDTPLDLGAFRKDRPTSVAVAKFPLAEEGRHVLRVTGRNDTSGAYVLKVTAYPAKSFKGSGTVDVDGAGFGLTAPAEALVTLKVVRGPGSDLVPIFEGLEGPPCAMPALVPGTKPGTATFRAPASGAYTVLLDGNGGTEGTFAWSAKVKAAKASKTPVRVNGSAESFPGPGPAPAALFLRPGQPVRGFASDGVDLVWREVKQTGGGGSQYRNSLHAAPVKGGAIRALENNLGTDQVPPEFSVAAGDGHAVVVVAGEMTAAPLAGGPGTVLAADVGNPDRVLVAGGSAVVLDTSELIGYDLGGGGPAPILSVDGTCHDVAAGGTGLVYAATNLSGKLEVRQAAIDGSGDASVAELASNPQFRALAARGTDVYVAVDDGNNGTDVLAFSTCETGTWRLLANSPNAPVDSMAVDDLNVYLLVDNAVDGIQVVQVPRGGGVPVVLCRSNPDADFAIDGLEVVAHGGYVQFLAADAGTDGFYRVKRR